MLSLDIGI